MAALPKPATCEAGDSPESVPEVKPSSTLSVRITDNTRQVIERIKQQFGYRTDAEVIRHALGTQLRVGQAIERGEKIYVGDEDGRLRVELVFVTQT